MAEAREFLLEGTERDPHEALQKEAAAGAQFLLDWTASPLDGAMNLSDVAEALAALAKFKEMVEKTRAKKAGATNELLVRREAVLQTERGRAVQGARSVFTDFDEEIRIPIGEGNNNRYSIQGRNYTEEDIDPDGPDYDPDIVFSFTIGHLQTYPDSHDFDYGGGNTEVALKLDSEGRVVYEFTGAALDSEFKGHIESLIHKKASEI